MEIDSQETLKRMISEDETPKLLFSQKRSKLRQESRVNERLRKSLQTCKVKNNMSKLKGLRDSTRSIHNKRRYQGLIAVLEHLLLPSEYLASDVAQLVDPDSRDLFSFGNKIVKGFTEFDKAIDIYLHENGLSSNLSRLDDERIRFRDALLDAEYGLTCILYTHTTGKCYIILDNDNVDICTFFNELTKEEEMEKLKIVFEKLSFRMINSALKSMDTEFDRGVFKSILSLILSKETLNNLGIHPDIAKRRLSTLENVWKELENSEIAADDMLKLRISAKAKKIEEELEKVENAIRSMRHSEKRRSDFEMRNEVLTERLTGYEDLVSQKTKYSKQRFNQAKKRIAQDLVNQNRLKKRKLGAGPPSLLDDEDEQFIAKAIESKGTVHGRRHDATLYLHHGVKYDDLLSLANYSLAKRGKRLIRSASPVYLRARPK